MQINNEPFYNVHSYPLKNKNLRFITRKKTTRQPLPFLPFFLTSLIATVIASALVVQA